MAAWRAVEAAGASASVGEVQSARCAHYNLSLDHVHAAGELVLARIERR